MRRLLPPLLLLLLAAPPSLGAELAWDGATPALNLAGGQVTLSPLLRLDADAGSYAGQSEPDGFRSGVNLRRGRLGLEGTLPARLSWRLVWEFGGPDPRDYGQPYEAQLAWEGIDGLALRLGAFTPKHLPDYSGDSFGLPFLERAAISNLAAGLASGDSRTALGAEAHGGRWVASAYATGGVLSTRNDDRQRGLAGRVAALLLDAPAAQLQLGLDAAWQFRPGTRGAADRLSLDDYPELRVDSRVFLDTGTLAADGAGAWGPEATARLGPLVLEGVYQQLLLRGTGEGTRRFEGWYLQGTLPLLGPPRRRDAETGTWEPPEEGLGRWGSVELAGRYSVADLRDGPVQGGRQAIWTGALTWRPHPALRLTAQLQSGRLTLEDRVRDFQALGLRAALSL
ncbi:OprO/OprP family phosphate-selective porin [Roseomonas sp. OT10]|uniref:porin n=1 Tax=Roseomonas cutis TaxID=2897332 RepID=UPI001E58EBA8|nr:porin [Roseomonas sp. OT10]UFN48972.1 OprO/OprP family phosphate-selective porin [Roseomonas sp. OT10]